MGIHHHFSPPFGTICLNFSKHQTSKSELATEILGGGRFCIESYTPIDHGYGSLTALGDPC